MYLIGKYYKSIASKIIINRNFDFWEFHEKELGKVGARIHMGKLVKYMLIGLLGKMLNPLNTINDLFAKNKYNIDPP